MQPKKKRGRPRKHVKDASLSPKIPKKRGRKPKSMTLVVKEHPKDLNFKHADVLIITLPISLDQVNANTVNANLFSKEHDVLNLDSIDKSINISDYIDQRNKDYAEYKDLIKQGTNDLENTITEFKLPINANVNTNYIDFDLDTKEVNIDYSVYSKQELINIIKTNKDSFCIDQIVKECTRVNNEYNYNVTSYKDINRIDNKIKKYDHKFKNTRCYEINTGLFTIDKNSVNQLPEHSIFCCWWDTELFDSRPVFMPKAYDGKTDTFFVMGNFCSYSCMKAYFFSSKENNKQLFDFYCRRVGHLNKVTIAYPRESLLKFGGPFAIEQFREKSKDENIIHELIFPPIRPINIYIQEINVISSNTDDKESLVLKRSKPLPGRKNTLMNFFK